jgi:sugar phosphate isomerase/epimerase
VHLDPCNLVSSPRLYYRSGDLIEECFHKLGRWIASCHAKDLDWVVEMNVHFAEVRPGLGSIDYRTYLKQLAGLDRDVPLMTEHLPNADEYQKAAQYIQGVGRSIGLHFE